MADMGENIRTVIVANAGINAVVAGRVHQSVVPESLTMPRIWYTRAASFEDVDFDGIGGLVDESWDIECHALSLDEAQDLSALVKPLFNGKRGTFGTDTIGGSFVEDHDDDYLPKGIGEDDDSHIHVAAISLQILH